MSSGRFGRNLAERWWTLFLWIVVGVSIVRLVVGVCVYAQPRLFESRMVLEEKLKPGAMRSSELELGTQVFKDVAARLDLETRWGVPPDQAVGVLRDSLFVERAEKGDLTIIRCRHTNAWDARDIAEVAAELYEGWERMEALGEIGPAASDMLANLKEQKVLEQRFAQHLREWSEIATGDRDTELAIKIVDDGMTLEEAVKIKIQDLRKVYTEVRGGQEIPTREVDGFPEAAIKSLKEEVSDYRRLRENFTKASAEVRRLSTALGGTRIPEPGVTSIVERAAIGREPVSPRVALWMAMTYLPGALLGAALWWFYLAKWRNPEASAARRARKVKETISVDY